ncbi:unnamed protein product [Cyprideis torosa]|uniref:Uncharacterized protein n=1 Tax=Cyprideis torosa TaxID=163714 RepID=A0A7R8WAD0_9CRUS|nr:unnamed protein product [Cyprideis torosa]CAG0888263.1 unnamed protein product [Cyprideis torosa]
MRPLIFPRNTTGQILVRKPEQNLAKSLARNSRDPSIQKTPRFWPGKRADFCSIRVDFCSKPGWASIKGSSETMSSDWNPFGLEHGTTDFFGDVVYNEIHEEVVVRKAVVLEQKEETNLDMDTAALSNVSVEPNISPKPPLRRNIASQFCLQTPDCTPKPPMRLRRENPDCAIFSRDVNDPSQGQVKIPVRQLQKGYQSAPALKTLHGSSSYADHDSAFVRGGFGRRSISEVINKLRSGEQLSMEGGRKALRDGVDRFHKTLQDIRTGLGALSQRFRVSTRRRCRLDQVAEAPSPTPAKGVAEHFSRSGAMFNACSTPIRLYSPFAIESPSARGDPGDKRFSPQNKETRSAVRVRFETHRRVVLDTVRSKATGNWAGTPSPASKVAAGNNGRSNAALMARLRHRYPPSNALSTFDSPSRKFGQDVANLNQGLVDLSLMADQVVAKVNQNLADKPKMKQNERHTPTIPAPPRAKAFEEDKENTPTSRPSSLSKDVVRQNDLNHVTEAVLVHFP